MRYTLIAISVTAVLSTSSILTFANSHKEIEGASNVTPSISNTWEDEAKDAWIDGKAEATLLFNQQLNSFDINTDVANGLVTLTGSVDNEIEKELAGELIQGIDGVSDVNNELSVVNPSLDKKSKTAMEFTDAKIATVIKSRLIFDSEVSGTEIDVDVEGRVVTLNGALETQAEIDLAGVIAKNTDDVKRVNNELTIDENAE